jgi:hypothetical protein
MIRQFRHVVTIAAALTFAPVAHAGPDPHMPDPLNGYCPGGGAGNVFEGYCDGAHYPDGSRVVMSRATAPIVAARNFQRAFRPKSQKLSCGAFSTSQHYC